MYYGDHFAQEKDILSLENSAISFSTRFRLSIMVINNLAFFSRIFGFISLLYKNTYVSWMYIIRVIRLVNY
ncbi:MAG: hypothetical protein BMS9Abin33_0601 [Gammaproteobacteria bacterium]|nr:MAG: hypothetical protein BMS9Abin33_0601 [Gammaproteobacteria bacterium]